MQQFTGVLIIALALGAANLPFISNRFFGLIALKEVGAKSIWLRLIEWLIAYVVVGSIAYFMEQATGQAHDQSWAFYAITFCLFATFAYPGIVYRFLYKARGT